MTNAASRPHGFHSPEEPLDQIKIDFPGVTLTRPFVSGVQEDPRSFLGKVRNKCAESWTHGMVPVYSFKLHPRQVREGRWDGVLHELAEWHLDQAPAMAVIWHEPENDLDFFGSGQGY